MFRPRNPTIVDSGLRAAVFIILGGIVIFNGTGSCSGLDSAKEDPVIIPEACVWKETAHIRTSSFVTGPFVTIYARMGSKWRTEGEFDHKNAVAVFDGQGFACSVRGVSKEITDPNSHLLSLPRDLLRATKAETFEKDGRQLTRYFQQDAKSSIFNTHAAIFIVDAKTGFPVSEEIDFGGEHDEISFELIPYDVAAHQDELFKTTDLRPRLNVLLNPPAQQSNATSKLTRPVIHNLLLTMLEESRQSSGVSKESAAAATVISSDELHHQHREKLARILNDIGWPTADKVGEDGERAMLDLLEAEYKDVPLLERASQLMNAAVSQNLSKKSLLAELIDAMRVGEGKMQLYGTQYVNSADGRLIQFPVEDPAGLDGRRKLAGLPTLQDQESVIAQRRANPKSSTPHASNLGAASLEPAKGLNSESDVRIGTIYIHSRDDKRATSGEHPTP